MQRTSNPAANNQVQKAPRRRLEHLADLQEGVDKFDMVPRCLSRAYFEGQFPEAKYKLLRIMMSHGEYFRVKRKYLEGIFAKKSLCKYLPELISEGYLEREELVLKSGGYENVYHVRSISDWLVYRQSVDGFLSDGRQGNDHKDTNPSSSSSTDSNPQSESKTENPCHNGGVDLIRTSITPTSEPKKSTPPLGKGVPSVAEEGFLYAESMAFLYSKRKNGGYDYAIANKEAEKFLQEFGKKSAQVLLNWAQETREIHDRVRVEPGMFKVLWGCFLHDTDLSDG